MHSITNKSMQTSEIDMFHLEMKSNSFDSAIIKRPLSAYHHFYRFQKKIFMRHNTFYVDNLLTEESKLPVDIPRTSNELRRVITQMWKNTSKAAKKKFKLMAKQDKKRFQAQLQKLPPYQYVDHAKEIAKGTKNANSLVAKSSKCKDFNINFYDMKHRQSAFPSGSYGGSITASTSDDYYIDAVGIKWSTEECKLLWQLSSYLENLNLVENQCNDAILWKWKK